MDWVNPVPNISTSKCVSIFWCTVAITWLTRRWPLEPRPFSTLIPPPPEELGAVHDELLGLENALYNLGTTVLNDSTKEKPSLGGVIPPKPAGAPCEQALCWGLCAFVLIGRRNDVVHYLASIEDLAHDVKTLILCCCLACWPSSHLKHFWMRPLQNIFLKLLLIQTRILRQARLVVPLTNGKVESKG